jgi:uncharacterized protein (TIGR04255 family)
MLKRVGGKMHLPDYPWVRFKKSPLRLVIGQVRFPIIPRFKQEGFIAPFQEAVRSEYPGFFREATLNYQLSQIGISQVPGESLWRFSTRDGMWSVVVGESALTLESRKYTSMIEFTNRFSSLMEVASEYLGVTERLRLGLRYTNEIRHSGANTLSNWRELLRPEFIGFEASTLLDGRVDHMLQEIQIERPDGILAIRHGLLNGTVVPPLPQEGPIDGRFYLIDLDYYDANECALDIAATIDQIKAYNDIMYRFFRWTLGDNLFSYLEPTDV